MDKYYHYYRKHDSQTAFLIGADSDISEVFHKFLNYGYLICVDFTDGRLVGTITIGDINRAMDAKGSLQNISAKNIANTECARATLEDIDDELYKLKKYKFLPVVDSNGIFRYFVASHSLDWNEAQDYEFGFWKKYFTDKISEKRIYYLEKINVFDPDVREQVIRKAKGATVIEIGAGPYCGLLGSMKDAARRIIIEPLADKYAELRNQFNVDWLHKVEEITFYSVGGERYIPELANKADLLICHNALDHTPDWPFVLGNMAAYVNKGGLLCLSTDIDHHGKNELIDGHYNITYNPQKLFRLIQNLGFSLLYKGYGLTWHHTTGVSVVGVKL